MKFARIERRNTDFDLRRSGNPIQQNVNPKVAGFEFRNLVVDLEQPFPVFPE